jgi:hypothetical protein
MDHPRVLLALAVASLVAVGCGGSGGGGAGDMLQDSDDPIDISGQYDVTVSLSRNTCGLSLPPADTTMLVQEDGTSAATIDVSLEGECNPKQYARDGNTLTLTEVSQLQLDLGCAGGDCIVDVETSTRLKFARGGSVTGKQSNAVDAAGGDCACVGVGFPCSVDLALAGEECSGCFECTEPQARSMPEAPVLLRSLAHPPAR